MISLKSLSELYDLLYDEADSILKEYDPCQFKDGSCVRDRTLSPLTKGGCCQTGITGHCVHSGPKGCEAKSLRCKTFLCNHLRLTPRTKLKGCLSALMSVGNIADKLFNGTRISPATGPLPLSLFKSKDEVLKRVKEARKQGEQS